MTDKQIIIDGVDVSGCKYYVENNGVEAQDCYELTDLCECNKENEFCYNNPNCYYKQLKRKEEECLEYNKELARFQQEVVPKYREKLKNKKQECETLASQLDFEVQKKECLEQECEELKIYIESNEQQVKEVETLVMDNDRLINELDQLKEQIKYQNNFIESLLKATNNSEWLDKTILDDEVGEIIEKIELDYVELDQLKATLTEIKEIAESEIDSKEFMAIQCMLNGSVDNKNKVLKQILQKISEVIKDE